jgi:hypothetical protein
MEFHFLYWLKAGQLRFSCRWGQEFFSTLMDAGQLSLLFSGHQGLFSFEYHGWSMKLTTYLYVVPRLRMHGALSPLPHTSKGHDAFKHRNNFSVLPSCVKVWYFGQKKNGMSPTPNFY